MLAHMVLISVMFFILPLQGMKNYAQVKAETKEYNDNKCPLTMLPSEILKHIFSYYPVHYYFENKRIARYLVEEREPHALMQSMNRFLRLRGTCKKFSELLTLKAIGNLCKQYTQEGKDKCFIGRFSQWDNEIIPILAHAGADINMDDSIVRFTVQEKYDEDLIQLFITYPNLHIPFFFYANTKEMAQTFIDKGVNVHATDKDGNNVLWYITKNGPAELIEFYLQCDVDVKTLRPDAILEYLDGDKPDPMGQSCLLHWLAKNHYVQDNMYKKGLLLIDAIPHMINQLNTGGQTPLDIAYSSFTAHQKYIETYGSKENRYGSFEKLIALFKSHGGLTAKEAKQLNNPTQ